MPTHDEIELAIKRVNRALEDHATVIPIYDAVILLQAYREESYRNIGIEGMEEPDGN